MKRLFLSSIVSLLLLVSQFAGASVISTEKGMWIWKIWQTDLQTVISTLRSNGVKWVVVKCGNSNSFYNRSGEALYTWASSYGGFNSVINQFHNNGIKVFGWHYVYSQSIYGNLGVTEADVSNSILNISGIDGLIIDAEIEYEVQGKGPIAQQYMQDIRKIHPNSFIAYSSYARVSVHPWLPWLEFGQYCDINMPQAYWAVKNYF